MIKPVYAHHLLPLDEADVLYEQTLQTIDDQDFSLLDKPNNEGGLKALKDRIVNAVISLKNKAAKSFGLSDGFSIRSCIVKLKDMISSIITRTKETVKTWSPRIRNFVDTLCNYIQDAIDYIKSEFE